MSSIIKAKDFKPKCKGVLENSIDTMKELKRVFDEAQTHLEVVRIDEILHFGSGLKISVLFPQVPFQSDDEQKEHS